MNGDDGTWITSDESDYTAQLTPGTYILREINVPQGYESAEDITFVLKNNGTVTIDGETVEDDDGTPVVKMVDESDGTTVDDELAPGSTIKNIYFTIRYKCDKDNLIFATDSTSFAMRDVVSFAIPTKIQEHTYKGNYDYLISYTDALFYPMNYTNSGNGNVQINIPEKDKDVYIQVLAHYECPPKALDNKILHIYRNPLTDETTQISTTPGLQKIAHSKHDDTYVYDHYLVEYYEYVYSGDEIIDKIKKSYYANPCIGWYCSKDASIYSSGILASARGTVTYSHSNGYDGYHDMYSYTLPSSRDAYIIDDNESTYIESNVYTEPSDYAYHHYYSSDKVKKESNMFQSHRWNLTNSFSDLFDYKVPSSASYHGEIYYTKQVINASHWLVGSDYTDKKKQLGNTKQYIVETTSGVDIPRYEDYEYVFVGAKVVGSSNSSRTDKLNGTILNDTTFHVDFVNGKKTQEVELYYKLVPKTTPAMLTGTVVPVVCVPSGGGNVQLDHTFDVTIPSFGKHEEANNQGYTTPDATNVFDPNQNWNAYYAKAYDIEFDFPVEYNGEVYNANQTIRLETRIAEVLSIDERLNGNRKYTFTVPVWVKDDPVSDMGKTVSYTGKVIVTPMGPNNMPEKTAENNIDRASNQAGDAVNTIPVYVYGDLYDFTVTNIQGDEIWSSILKLPSTNNVAGEYKTPKSIEGVINANKLPIGQEAQRVTGNSKYYNALRLGTKILFSVNTKGITNNSISITPKLLYVSKDGTKREEVVAYTKSGSSYIPITSTSSASVTRSSNMGDKNKLTVEFGKEKQRGVKLYNNPFNTAVGIGKYNGIEISSSFRLPYLAYLAGEGLEWDSAIKNGQVTEDDVLRSVSHWYGDYMIPPGAKFATPGANQANLATEFKNHENGYVVLLFKIESKKQDGSSYIKYDGGVQKADGSSISTKSTWKEREDMTESYITGIKLPKPAVNGTEQSLGNIKVNYITTEYVPVAVYSTNVSTATNYDTTGTH